MPDETAPAEPVKELTPKEKLHKATEAYFAAINRGNKEAAAKIHADNNLPYSVGNHS